MIRALHLPPGTRVEAVTQYCSGIERLDQDDDVGGTLPVLTWRVWLGIKNKQVPPEKYEGTYLELLPDGSVLQLTTDRQGYEVMESIYENRSARK